MNILDADGYTDYGYNWWINDGIIGILVDNDGIMVYTKLIHFSLWYNWWINDASAYDMDMEMDPVGKLDVLAGAAVDGPGLFGASPQFQMIQLRRAHSGSSGSGCSAGLVLTS